MRNRQQTLDLVAEIEPVGQRRQFVVTRQMGNSGFGVAPFGDVSSSTTAPPPAIG